MLINLRNALMTGKLLPYDAEVEYLESTGTQYIPFEVPFYGIDITTSHVANNNSYGIAGAWNGGGRANSVKYTTIQSRGWTITNYSDSGNIFSRILTQNAPTRVTVHGTSVTVNDTSYTMGAAWEPNYDVLKFALFGCYNRGDTVNPLSGRIYHCSLYDANGILVRDFIPVRKGTVGYLYDRVSGKLFGNAGTGDFVLGPDVVPVAYIESHGTEWIDTGVATSATAKIETDFLLHNIYTQAVYGNLIARSYFGVFFGTNSTGVLYCNDSTNPVSPNFSLGAETIYKVVQQGNNIVINGKTYTTTGARDDAQTMLLFARRQEGSVSRNINGRIFQHKIHDANDTPVRKFLPVRVGTEGAMMDVLTRRIYRNAGTGAFSYGNDLKYPIPSE